MNPIIVLAAVVTLVAPGAARSQYKCVSAGGSVSFQHQPCDGNSRQSKLDIQVPAPPSDGAAPRPVLPELARLQSMERERRIRELQFDIRDTENSLENRTSATDRELLRLKRQKNQTANNLAGATLRNSISGEMQAVTAKFQALNDVDLARLQQLRSELAKVQQGAR